MLEEDERLACIVHLVTIKASIETVEVSKIFIVVSIMTKQSCIRLFHFLIGTI